MLTHPLFVGIAASAMVIGVAQPEAPKAESPKQAPAEKAATANPAVVPVSREKEHAGWWQRHEAITARVKQGYEKGDVGMVFIGDSITQGWEEAGKETWKSSFAKRNAMNFGISGDRTQHVLWRLEHSDIARLAKPVPKDAKPPKLAVIMIGTNNTDTDTPEQIAAGIKAIVASLQQKLPETNVLLLGIFPRAEKPDEALRHKVTETNNLIKPLGNLKGVTFLDITDRFIGEGAVISGQIMPDFLHLSPKGYDLWAKGMEPTLHELADEK